MSELRVVHRTDYAYQAVVTTSYGRSHLLPRDLPGQRCVASELRIEPAAGESRDHVDFFGNTSTFFAVVEPHQALAVTSTCTVDVDRVALDLSSLDDRPWEQVRDSLPATDSDREFRLSSPLIRPAQAVADYAAMTFTPGRAIGAALGELLARIHHEFRYRSGSTTVTTTLPEVLAKGEGVCQDFAHLAIGCLRSVGLAARYVSGYLETLAPPGRPKLQGADASHAWISVRVPGHGWVDLDPTNDQVVDDRYVILAWGRDYSDVPPLKGVIVTNSKSSTMRVSVDVTRVR